MWSRIASERDYGSFQEFLARFLRFYFFTFYLNIGIYLLCGLRLESNLIFFQIKTQLWEYNYLIQTFPLNRNAAFDIHLSLLYYRSRI